jgi:hypothetical protein
LQDGVDRFFFGIADETTGIDNDNAAFRFVGIVFYPISVRFELAHHMLRIHKVFGAAHSDYIYKIGFLHFFNWLV